MSELSENILKLRESGLSYNKIAEQLGCSKGTVSYHCGDGQKEKSAKRKRDLRTHVVFNKTERFRHISREESSRVYISSIDDQKRFKVMDFQREPDNGARTIVFSYKDVEKKIGENPICYLSGRPINLDDGRSYEFDHVTPRRLGGDNSLENLGITTKPANRAKSDLSLEEFLELCKDILENHGYSVLEPTVSNL